MATWTGSQFTDCPKDAVANSTDRHKIPTARQTMGWDLSASTACAHSLILGLWNERVNLQAESKCCIAQSTTKRFCLKLAGSTSQQHEGRGYSGPSGATDRTRGHQTVNRFEHLVGFSSLEKSLKKLGDL
jgi:hypothetical protein